jgi:hypothetical protein
MRMIFGVMSLLIVLAIVGTLGKKQLQALGQVGGATTRVVAPLDSQTQAVSDAVMGRARDGAATVAVPGGMPGATLAPTVEATVPMQAQAIQNRMRDATTQALQQGAERNNNAQP